MSVEERLENHVEEANKRFCTIDEKLDSIKDNHLAHIQEDLSSIKITTALNSEYIGGIKKVGWALISGVLAALGLALAKLVS